MLWSAWLGMAASLHLFFLHSSSHCDFYHLSFFLSFLSTISQLASSVCSRTCYQTLSWSWFPSDFKSGTWVSSSEWYVGFFFPYVIFLFHLTSLSLFSENMFLLPIGRRLSARWTHGLLKTTIVGFVGVWFFLMAPVWICNAFISLSFSKWSNTSQFIWIASVMYSSNLCMLFHFLKKCLSWLLHLTVTEILTWKWKSDQLMNESSQ